MPGALAGGLKTAGQFDTFMTPTSRLNKLVERLRAYRPQSYDWQPTIEEPPIQERHLKVVPAPAWMPAAGNVQEARQIINDAIIEYLAEPWPSQILLVRAMPGTGKTTIAVAIAESLAAQGKRVAYAGPRHDFFDDIIDKAAMPDSWYEWLPRQQGREDDPLEHPQTCLYTEQINKWIYRGYDGMDFCSGVCGWKFVNEKCRYHLQKTTHSRLLFIQHNHVALGHPLAASFDVLVGDESPVSSFCHRWQIPDKYILPGGMLPDDPMTEILHTLSTAAQYTESTLSGPDLLDMLGGPAAVLEATKAYNIPLDAEVYSSIHQPEEADNVAFFHLPALATLLEREATQALEGKNYPHRVVVTKKTLMLLLRRTPTALPAHTIWLDATGRPEIYRRIFGRPIQVVDARSRIKGRVIQVVDRANGKQAITGTDGDTKTEHARHAELLIQEIVKTSAYQRPSVIGFKNFVDRLAVDGALYGHFYAARGTNAHEEADAVFIVGAPQASPYQIVEMAKMIFWEDDVAFDTAWVTKDVPYLYEDGDGNGRAYPVSGFWKDRRLQAILETIREDEIVQAAHRGRPVNHAVDIWLLTNVPVDGLPPDQLTTMREIMGVGEGVNIWKWRLLLDSANAGDGITTEQATSLGINYATARQYMRRLAAEPGWEMVTIKSGKGRPKMAVKRRLEI